MTFDIKVCESRHRLLLIIVGTIVALMGFSAGFSWKAMEKADNVQTYVYNMEQGGIVDLKMEVMALKIEVTNLSKIVDKLDKKLDEVKDKKSSVP